MSQPETTAYRSSTLDHIEKTLADAYRKEIDQEENVWRSLPFFAATLALQLAALFQIFDKLPTRFTLFWWVALAFSGVAGISTIIALIFLSISIFPAKFRYIAPEPELLDYAEGLDQDEKRSAGNAQTAPIDSLAILKAALARQYAVGTHHNRQINQRRALRRSVAGLATLVSVFGTLALAVTVVVTYISKTP
jgi:hypothetical protein